MGKEEEQTAWDDIWTCRVRVVIHQKEVWWRDRLWQERGDEEGVWFWVPLIC